MNASTDGWTALQLDLVLRRSSGVPLRSCISLSCPHLFRYVASCLILQKRLKHLMKERWPLDAIGISLSFPQVTCERTPCGSFSTSRLLLGRAVLIRYQADRGLQRPSDAISPSPLCRHGILTEGPGLLPCRRCPFEGVIVVERLRHLCI